MKRTDQMKRITFSIPADLNNMLRAMVERRELSRFVAQALEHALSEKKNVLKQSYTQGNKDPDRLKTIKEWEALDVEGWHD